VVAAVEAGGEFWGAHPSRVLAKASRLSELLWVRVSEKASFPARKRMKVRFGETPKPAPETGALPRTPLRERFSI